MISATDQYKALVARLEAINPSNVTENTETPVEECGGMMSMAPKQQDNVTMNVTAQGAGGIRDLMNLLHSMEQASSDQVVVGNPGGEIELPVGEEVSDGGFGDATTRPEEDTYGIDDVVKTGNDIHSKGAERPKMNGGGNPMQETLVSQLSQMYNEIKEANELSELSPATLKSYIKKASGSAASKGLTLGNKMAKGDEVDRYTNRIGMYKQDDENDRMRDKVGASRDEIEKLTSKTKARIGNISKATDRLEEVKKEEKFDALKHVKDPTKGEKEAAKDVKRGSYADRAAMLKSAEADGRLKD